MERRLLNHGLLELLWTVYSEKKLQSYLELRTVQILLVESVLSTTYSVVSIERTGLLNYFEVFVPPLSHFHVIKIFFAPPCTLFSCNK
jgi:hypothetical protein